MPCYSSITFFKKDCNSFEKMDYSLEFKATKTSCRSAVNSKQSPVIIAAHNGCHQRSGTTCVVSSFQGDLSNNVRVIEGNTP